MMDRPYPMMRPIREVADTSQIAQGKPVTWVVELELSDTPNVSALKERLAILTHVSAPLPNHPQAVQLAALLRVQDLLAQQIRAMQSP